MCASFSYFCNFIKIILPMKQVYRSIFTLFIFSILSQNLSAQYGTQFENRGFEQWTSRGVNAESEPVHWHSGGTATGDYSGLVSSQIEQSSQTRPGSTGVISIRVFPKDMFFVTANGNLTNGRMNAGSMSPDGSDNYNYTQRSNNVYNTPITTMPDSLSAWVCFRSNSTTDKALFNSVIHGDADYRLLASGGGDPSNMLVATASEAFTRTAGANASLSWKRLSIPYQKNGSCTDVRYILLSVSTNQTPGSGSSEDDLYIDDILLIYNPSLKLEQLSSNHFFTNTVIGIPFTLTGTMSADNLNSSPNRVIAQLSDVNGSFDNPTELGSLTTNTSGSIWATVPDVPESQHYRIRVVSTNYPMIGENIQEVSIEEGNDVEELLATSKVYPNPFNTETNISADRDVKNITVFDVYGRLVMEQQVSGKQLTIDLCELSAGTYLLKVDYGDHTSVHRIVRLAQ